MRNFACIVCFFVFFTADVSFAQQECSTVIMEQGAEFSIFRGRVEPTPDADGLPTLDWAQMDFDDSDPDLWEVGTSGIGYGDQLENLGTVINDMRNVYWTLYLRHTFEIEDLAAINSLVLNMDYDDAFVAYLNGVEIARRNVAGTPPTFETAAGGNHESTGELEAIPLLDIDSLEEGTNVLAIQMHNTTLNSSDLIMISELIANPGECPSAISCSQDDITGEVLLSWSNGAVSYEAIQVWRNGVMIEDDIGGDQTMYVDSAPISGEVLYGIVAIDTAAACEQCEAIECTVIIFDEADILIGPGEEWSYLTGVEPGPDPEWNTLDFDDFDWELGPTGIGYGDNDDATILDDMRNNYVTIYTRKVFELELATVESLVLSCAVDDGFVAYVNGTEIGRFNVAEGEVFNNTPAITANPTGEPVDPGYIPVELSIAKELLVEGENIIAVSVHNAGLNSSDLTFIPTLIQIPGEGGGPGPAENLFLRGDVDNNGFVNLTDAVALLLYLFQQGNEPGCTDSSDIDDNGFVNLTDGVSLLNHLFRAGPAPQPPGFLECGVDPTDDDALGNCSSSACVPAE